MPETVTVSFQLEKSIYDKVEATAAANKSEARRHPCNDSRDRIHSRDRCQTGDQKEEDAARIPARNHRITFPVEEVTPEEVSSWNAFIVC